MKNNHMWQWALTFSGSMALCGVLAAQSPTTSTPQGGGQRGMATPQQGAISATGCLQRGDASAPSSESSSTAPSGASAVATGSFVLKNARVGGAAGTASGAAAAGAGAGSPASGSTGPGPTGSAGSSTESSQASNSGAESRAGAAAGARGRELRLMAAPSVNLSEHVGHQVMVTGAFGGAMTNTSTPGTPSSSAPEPSAAGATPAGAPGVGGTMNDRGPLKVSTISMISATCSGS